MVTKENRKERARRDRRRQAIPDVANPVGALVPISIEI